MAVRHGAICYLDEIVEARQDTTVAIHPLTDARRILPLESTTRSCRRTSISSSRSPTTRVTRARSRIWKDRPSSASSAIDFGYPPPAVEARHCGARGRDRRQTWPEPSSPSRSGPAIFRATASTRGASTRMLIHAGRLVRAGLPLEAAVRSSIVLPITDNLDIREALGAADRRPAYGERCASDRRRCD